MRKISLLFLFVWASYMPSYAQSYAVDLIPQELKSYAKGVVRLDERTVIIQSPSDMIYRIHRVTTILNNSGADLTQTVVFYNKSRKIKSLSVNVYNAHGDLIHKAKESDFSDRSYISNYSLFEDARIKSFQPVISTYPITIEENIEIRFNQTLAIPEWHPQGEEGLSVETGSFELIKSPDYEIKYQSLGLAKPEIGEAGKSQRYQWTLKNVRASKYEPYSINEDLRLANLKISPVKFSYDGVTGEYVDWKTYGKWVYDKLLTGRSDLPETTIAKVKAMVKDVKDPKEAARLIYEYAQQKNRYVSVQIGIGGFQPMKASEVDALSYGDCKALVNYTSALLKVAGIESIYTEIYAGSEKIDYKEDFASIGQGNHIILCLPFANDTTWLECTSKEAPFGFLGSFTQGRKALMIKEDGGELVKTPTYTWEKNTQLRNATFMLDSSGILKGRVKTSFSGIQYENRESFSGLSPVEKEQEIKSQYAHIPDFNMISYRLDRAPSEPQWKEELEISSPHFGNPNGDYLMFDINPVNVSQRSVKEVLNRKNEHYINIGYLDVDTIRITIPANYRIESLPESVRKSYDFGSYELTAQLQDDELIAVRKMILKEGLYPASAYEDFIGFYDLAQRNDRARCVLKKKQE